MGCWKSIDYLLTQKKLIKMWGGREIGVIVEAGVGVWERWVGGALMWMDRVGGGGSLERY
jgi:hypothetical protein